MKTKLFMASCLLVLLFLKTNAQENNKHFGWELSGGVSLATRNLNDANLNTGFGFEGLLHYRFMPHTGVYAGWGWNKFSADKSFAGDKMDFEETGYVCGFQFNHPVANSSVSYFLRAGGLYNHIETENEKGDIINNSGHGLGWQLACGLAISLGAKWSLTPGVKFNALSKNTTFEGSTKKLDLNYLSFRIGIARKF